MHPDGGIGVVVGGVVGGVCCCAVAGRAMARVAPTMAVLKILICMLFLSGDSAPVPMEMAHTADRFDPDSMD